LLEKRFKPPLDPVRHQHLTIAQNELLQRHCISI
jgi:hypothetical protein